MINVDMHKEKQRESFPSSIFSDDLERDYGESLFKERHIGCFDV
jgi:hypothetical protein